MQHNETRLARTRAEKIKRTYLTVAVSAAFCFVMNFIDLTSSCIVLWGVPGLCLLAPFRTGIPARARANFAKSAEKGPGGLPPSGDTG